MKKTIVVTGGTGALGQAVTMELLARDFNVVVTYLDESEWQALTEAVGTNQQLDGYEVNVTDQLSLRQFAVQLESKHPSIAGLVCLVGGYAPGTFGDAIDQTWDKMMTLNGKSFLLTVNTLLPLLKSSASAESFSHIVGVAARPALEPAVGLGIYAASKATIVSLVGTMAKELRDDFVTINAIAPSTIDTPANHHSMPKADTSRWVKPEQIANTIAYYLSDASAATSGTVIPVYGRA